MIFRLRLRGTGINIEISPFDLAATHPALYRLRKALIDEHGDPAKVDHYLIARFGAAFGDFSHKYIAEMSARIDRIFGIRDHLAASLDTALRGEPVLIAALQKQFNDLSNELNALASPRAALEKAGKLEVPPEPPPGTRAPDEPAPRRGSTGGAPPPDPLAQISGEQARAGLRIVEDQTAVANLRERIAAIAQKNPKAAADVLRGIAKFLTGQNAEELRGLNHFLEVADDPSALVRLFAATEQFASEGLPDWTGDARAALRMMRDFTPETARGLSVVFDLNFTAGTALRIFHNFRREPGIALGAFESLARLHGHSGLHKVVRFLAHETNPENQKAVQGQLLTANQLLDRYPDAKLVFEEPHIGPDGRLRIGDVIVTRPGGIPIHVEVKFYTTFRSLGADARGQLAADILQDAALRRQYRRPDGTMEPPFAAMLWRFERNGLAAELSQARGTAVTNAEVVAEIKRRLRAVFREHEQRLRRELGPDFETYRAMFEDISFVELY